MTRKEQKRFSGERSKQRERRAKRQGLTTHAMRGQCAGQVQIKSHNVFSEQKAEQITNALSSGEPMAAICKAQGIGYRTVFRWMDENPSFSAAIARARDIGADAIADEAFQIADTGNMDDTQRARLRVETRLKLLAKWNPKRYGDKLQVDADVRLQVELVDATSVVATVLPHAVQALPKPEEDPL